MQGYVLLLLHLAVFSPAFTQNTFIKLYGTEHEDEASFVEVLPDGSFIVAGQSGQDAALVKFSQDGTVVWSKTYGGAGYDKFVRMLSCSDGNFIALGETNSFGAGDLDIYLVKFNADGNVIWQRTLGGASDESPRGICEVADGYVVSGGTLSFGFGFWDIYVEKLNFSGATLWSKSWGGAGGINGELASEPFPGPDGQVWVSGLIYVSSNNHDAFLFRLNSLNGNLIGGARYAWPANNGFFSLDLGGAGYLAGGGSWTGNSQYPWVMSFNSSGALVWAKRYETPGGFFDGVLETTPDGGAICTAKTLYNASQSQAAIIWKIDANGNVEWATNHPFDNVGTINHTRQTPDGGYVTVGHTYGDNGKDMFIMKTDSQGKTPQCCSENATIPVITISPQTIAISPGTATGPPSAPAFAGNSPFVLNMQDFCSHPLTVELAAPPPLNCFNQLVTLDGSASSSGPQIVYEWSSGDGLILSGGNTPYPTVGSPGLYVLVITDQESGCSVSDSVLVKENDMEGLETLLFQPPCHGDLGRIEITGIIGGEAPFLYSVDGGQSFQTAPVFTGLAPGTYLVLAQDAQGCQTEMESHIIEAAPALLEISLGPNLMLEPGAAYQLEAQVSVPHSQITQIIWNPSTGLSCSNCLNPLATPQHTTTYTVEIWTIDGCIASASIQLAIEEAKIFAPNVFSPNGDGENDVFHLFARPGAVSLIRRFLIFDRWGELVFEYYNILPNDPAFGWDGTHRGKLMKPQLFAWRAEVEFANGQIEQINGTIALVR